VSQCISYIIVLLGAVLWGITGTAQTFMSQTIQPLAVGASGLAVGGFSLLIIFLVLPKHATIFLIDGVTVTVT